jgi:hypothetical protein
MNNSFEKPKKILKNALLTAVAVTGMLGAQEVKAGNGGGNNKPLIENLQTEHIVRGVESKDLKKTISDYESSSQLALEMFIEGNKTAKFTLTEAVGQTHAAAKLSAEQKLGVEGKVSRFAFTKNLANGNVSVILIAVEN